MEEKKTYRADLENKRLLFFLTGFGIALALFYIALEWKTPVDEFAGLDLLSPYYIESELTGDFSMPANEQISAPQEKNDLTSENAVNEDFNIVDKLTEKIETETELAPLEKDSSIALLPLLTPKELVNSDLQLPVQSASANAAQTAPNGAPQFPGGNIAMIRFIHQNLQYPPDALKQRIQGRVWCSFVVEKNGAIADLRLEKGYYPLLDDEALRVLKLMPKWIPATENGLAKRVRVYTPIVFKL